MPAEPSGRPSGSGGTFARLGQIALVSGGGARICLAAFPEAEERAGVAVATARFLFGFGTVAALIAIV